MISGLTASVGAACVPADGADLDQVAQGGRRLPVRGQARRAQPRPGRRCGRGPAPRGPRVTCWACRSSCELRGPNRSRGHRASRVSVSWRRERAIQRTGAARPEVRSRPRRPPRLEPRAAHRARRRDPRLAGGVRVAHRRPPRPQPRRRRADDRAAPRLRLPARHADLGHRTPGLRAQAAHRPARRLGAAQAHRRPVRLPEPRRERARPRREQPRVHLAVVGRRPRAGLRAHRAAAPRRRGDRRRRAHRRDGLGGAQQHRGGARTATSSSSSTTTAAPTPRRSAAWPTGSPRCGCSPATSGCWRPGKHALARTPVVGGAALRGAARAQGGGEGRAQPPRSCSPTWGSSTSGPVDGHDVAAIESALRRASSFGGPVIVHVVTQQGPRLRARRERRRRADAQPGRVRPDDGPADRAADGRVDVGVRRGDGEARRRPARTSSRSPRRCSARPGSSPFAEAFPDRCFDVGIAEQHALTSAAGLAAGGLHPVVAIYSTFLNRAFDQLLMDVALHRQAVTLVLDRAGRHRQRRALAQRHVGPLAAGHRAGHPGGRPARRRDAAGGAGRGRRRRRRADRAPLPEGRRDRFGARGAPGRRGGRPA